MMPRPSFISSALLVLFAIAAGTFSGAAQAQQNPFEAVIKVNDLAITRYELAQRARMLQLFRAPGNPQKLAREQLIEDRLKLDAATNAGFVLEDEQLMAGMEEFAGRANLSAEEMITSLGQAGVDESSFRDFVRAGMTWREFSRARFAPQINVDEEDIARARLSFGNQTSVRVLLSEIIMPLGNGDPQAIQDRANQISQYTTEAEFAAAARRYSATESAGRGGRMEWVAINDLPEGLRPVVLGLAPGEVSDPLPLQGAIALFQLRDIEETDQPAREYEEIEYAAYYIDGGRTEQALARAARIDADTDTCDDLYGIAHGQPEQVLERGSKAPSEIPDDIRLALTKLDPGEISTAVTRSGGQTLVLLMLCSRTPKTDGEAPGVEQLTNFIQSRRLDSYASAYLEELRAEARIVELE
ncbi:peptidylprolyl isomerase [Roseovarius atlanticus]|nr:peptidylprolyl isomerase [Roseovarius atlanticus]MBY6123877.1 peptidylprolyl isomerase [Roseovarius atlanticus]MBY6148372.1 peptidylprolyl isomerase [Roseovarius atlanticus]